MAVFDKIKQEVEEVDGCEKSEDGKIKDILNVIKGYGNPSHFALPSITITGLPKENITIDQSLVEFTKHPQSNLEFLTIIHPQYHASFAAKLNKKVFQGRSFMFAAWYDTLGNTRDMFAGPLMLLYKRLWELKFPEKATCDVITFNLKNVAEYCGLSKDQVVSVYVENHDIFFPLLRNLH